MPRYDGVVEQRTPAALWPLSPLDSGDADLDFGGLAVGVSCPDALGKGYKAAHQPSVSQSRKYAREADNWHSLPATQISVLIKHSFWPNS